MPEASEREAQAARPRAEALDEVRAFEEQLTTHGRDALRLARFLGYSPQDAADVVQEASILAWRYRRSRRGPWRPWFLAIVRRVSYRQPVRWTLVPSFWRPGEEKAPEHLLGGTDIGRALTRLPAGQRAALWLRYGRDLTYRDVSRILGVREGAAKMLVSRARATLRRELPQQP